MLVLLVIHAAVALIAPALVRAIGGRGLYLVALAPAGAAVWAAAHIGRTATETVEWIPQLGLSLAFRLDTLSWLLVLLVGGVGALVLAYCAHYVGDRGEQARHAGLLVAFAGTMLGLVLADDLLLLYVFWELTSVLSYLLIASDPGRRVARRAAMQALLVTTLGGLAMLVGIVMLGAGTGTHRWSELAQSPPAGTWGTVAVVLILAGALAKSAILPFGAWLPAAMAAPTPVSAYLHAAAMVKAGVFLVALLAPAFAGVLAWQLLTVGAGLATLIFAGLAALRQHDLKLLLAYGTVSQLGLLVAVLGAGTRAAALAGLTLVLAHALFKSALFLTVGAVDHATGTRDLRKLSGLGRRLPMLAVAATLAAASMAGAPPLLGFLGKEALFAAFATGEPADTAALIAMVLGATLTVGYSLRFLWGAFGTKPGVVPVEHPHAPGPGLLAAPVLLSAAGLAGGLAARPIESALEPYPLMLDGVGVHLALWHGLSLPLGLTVLALAGGYGVFRLTRDRVKSEKISAGAWVYEQALRGVDRLAVELTGATQRGSLPGYLGVILIVLVVIAGTVLAVGAPWPTEFRVWDTPLQAVAGVAIIAAAIGAVRAQRRLAAFVLAGAAGYAVSMLFILHGAPDLALTQALVETAGIVMAVLVLRRLPAKFSERPLRASRRWRIVLGVSVGLAAAGMAFVTSGGRTATPVSERFADLSVSYGGGSNIVNVILVDIRAWDTMGEISVLVVAATGVASLIFQRTSALRRRAETPAPKRALAAWTGKEDSVIMQVVTRLIFHTIVLFSIYLLLSGHNAPGGGFAGGLVAALALTVRYLAGGRRELNRAAPVDAGVVLGTGLLIAVGTGVGAMLLGGQVLQTAIVDIHVPLLGDLHVATSTIFDVGVYLIVVGLILDILRSLGAEPQPSVTEETSETQEQDREKVTA
ncbi:Na+/H+ antiporter subunit A [Catenuloplanes japonicus]|uniref:Na+/H+ antiporter subunit A n=1 Tax=Catenuloplanes japonicus TaxID=33876 RepID=UPI00068F77B8|nr:Na+/H+ antiporter subunit A [Catenuloplanes japonicus]